MYAVHRRWFCVMAFSNLSDCADTQKKGVCVDNYKPRPSSRHTLACERASFVWHVRRDSSVHRSLSLSLCGPKETSFSWFSPALTSMENVPMCIYTRALYYFSGACSNIVTSLCYSFMFCVDVCVGIKVCFWDGEPGGNLCSNILIPECCKSLIPINDPIQVHKKYFLLTSVYFSVWLLSHYSSLPPVVPLPSTGHKTGTIFAGSGWLGLAIRSEIGWSRVRISG